MTKDRKMLLLTIFVAVLGVLFFTFIKPAPKQNFSATITSEPEITMQNSEELKIEDLVIGSGAEAVAGKSITVNYSGTLLDGTKFDSSYDRGVPFTFTLGAGEVIKGWDQGFVGMKVGGKRKLIIPASLGYGAQGAGEQIPPNSTLVFEVELLEVK